MTDYSPVGTENNVMSASTTTKGKNRPKYMSIPSRFLSILLVTIIVTYILTGCSSDDVEKQLFAVAIVVDYQEVLFATNAPLEVLIDGASLGDQDAGTKGEYLIELEAGIHEFQLKHNALYSTDKLEFEVSEDGEVFNFGAKTRLTFGVEVWYDGVYNIVS